MKLQNLTIIFIIIILPVVAVMTIYINYEIKTIEKQKVYNSGIISATHDAIYAFEKDTQNNDLSKNPEQKRGILKSCVNVFENSFSNTCKLDFYGNDVIEKYIPAMMFGMYDGFYLYAPYQTENGYKHELRNYVYYSETIPDTDITIRYSLDNYMVVSGTFNSVYETRSGYWINVDSVSSYINQTGESVPPFKTYDKHTKSIINNTGVIFNDAKKYIDNARNFTEWFNNNVKNKANYFKNTSDPEDINSPFVQHKREIMKKKIQTVLNNSISLYAKNTGQNYKMPVLIEEDWNKVYSNISFVTFVQGMNLGFKNYNGYCVMNSTNHSEYVNPNLLYFIEDVGDSNYEYHSIKCNKIRDKMTTGYKIGDFNIINVDVADENDQTITNRESFFKHSATACYGCVNINDSSTLYEGSSSVSAYDYVMNSDDEKLKKSYFTSLARERWQMQQIYDALNLINY